MSKIISYIAVSLNGKIARLDGSVDWLDAIPNPDGTDYGYGEFYKSIGSTIQGYSTYQFVKNLGVPFPYTNTTNYVITRKQDVKDTKDVMFVKKDHIDFVKKLKMKEGKDIWLIGGGKVNTLLLNEGLIDKMMVFVMPIIIPDGIDLFASKSNQTMLKLVSLKSYPSGVVELIYQL